MLADIRRDASHQPPMPRATGHQIQSAHENPARRCNCQDRHDRPRRQRMVETTICHGITEKKSDGADKDRQASDDERDDQPCLVWPCQGARLRKHIGAIVRAIRRMRLRMGFNSVSFILIQINTIECGHSFNCLRGRKQSCTKLLILSRLGGGERCSA